MVALPKLRFAEGADYSHAVRAFTATLVALVVLALLAAVTCARAQSPDFASEVEERVVNLTNEVRAKSALAPLQGEARLTDAARAFASHLASTGRLEHDADGTTPPERVKKRGYAYCIVAENLGMEFSSGGFTAERLSRNFVDGWMDSPTHRGNIVQPDVTQIGVGVSRSRAGEYYAVQVFARPMAQMTRFRIANRANATVRYEYRGRGVTLGPRQARNHESCVGAAVKLDSSGQDVLLQPRDGGRYAITESARGVYRIAEE
jgi:uncharacterized protein YkwD